MHVLLIVHQFEDGRIGGTERYTLNLAQALLGRGYKVTVLTFDEDKSIRPHLVSSIVAGVPTISIVSSLQGLADPVHASYAGDCFLDVFRQVLEEAKPDVIHITHPGNLGLGFLDICYQANIPVVATLTDYWAICPTSQLLRVNGDMCPGPVDIGQCAHCITQMGARGVRFRRLAGNMSVWTWRFMLWLSQSQVLTTFGPLRWLASLRRRQAYIRSQLDKVKVIFCPGAFQRDMLVANGLSAEKLVHAPHGILNPGSLASVHTSADVLRCAYIGPLAEHKGALLPIQALAQLGRRTDIELDYWGSVAETPYAQKVLKAIAADSRVQHHGIFEYDRIGEVLANVDIMIIPSVWYENTPTILYEAFAAGVPVIASDLGGMRELVQAYEGGWLFPVGDISALAQRLAQLADEPVLVANRRNSIRPVPDFDGHLQLVLETYSAVTGR